MSAYIEITRGDSRDIKVTALLPNGSPYDITDMQARLAAKYDIRQAVPDIELMIDNLDATGEMLFHLTPTDTAIDPGSYAFEVELSKTDRSFVQTIVAGGTLVIQPEVIV